MFKRNIYHILMSRLQEPRKFIQVLAGPRQVGKTTVAQQVAEKLAMPSHFASADEPTLQGRSWIEQQWETGRRLARREPDFGSDFGPGLNSKHLYKKFPEKNGAVLFLDEIQKIANWSESVKRLWDEDASKRVPLKVVLLGSSPLLIQKGLTENLAGRFERIPVTHWTYREMREAFGWTLDQFIYFGGYPGAAELIKDQNRWIRYIRDSLIETSISRDVFLLNRVDKPALLRRLFQLGCEYSGKILSYQKMLGQLQDAGNTTTLAHYLDLLSGAGMITGLQKYAAQKVRQRASSPKLQVLNNALMSAQKDLAWAGAKQSTDYWGQLVESAVGAHLFNSSQGTSIQLFYWREGEAEVDFVLSSGKVTTAIEVKSGVKNSAAKGMEAFDKAFKPKRKLLIGNQGISLEDFFLQPAGEWVG